MNEERRPRIGPQNGDRELKPLKTFLNEYCLNRDKLHDGP